MILSIVLFRQHGGFTHRTNAGFYPWAIGAVNLAGWDISVQRAVTLHTSRAVPQTALSMLRALSFSGQGNKYFHTRREG